VKTKQTVTGEGNASRVLSRGRTQIKFESVSGESLQKRFNQLARFYSSVSSANSLDWTAEAFKKSLIATIERGTVIVTQNDERGLA